MTWYKPKSWFGTKVETEEKNNPAQGDIARAEGSSVYSEADNSYGTSFDNLEAVNRATSMIVSACASLDYDVKSRVITDPIAPGMREKTLHTLLNFRPNPYQSTQEFRTHIFTDMVLEGNIFIYYDGAHLYHLPARYMEVLTDPVTLVAGYKYNGNTTFKPSEVIHIKDISSSSIYRGSSRLTSAQRSIKVLGKMQTFQDQFFDNGAVAGIILTTDNTLSQNAKDKTVANWTLKYSPKSGARKPLILDSGLKPSPMAQSTFQEMDFDTSIKSHDIKILKALGVPPVLLDGGNNANISPNLRLFYLETVLPIVRKLVSGIERFYGYDVSPVTADVSALQPELKDVASYHTTLVNGGILTPNEARIELRREADKDPGSDKLRVPANIAGSAANPSEGGAPKKPKEPSKE